VHPDAAPRARVSLKAIVANVRRADADAAVIVDLRRDARGHGLVEVGRALLAETDARFMVDESGDAALAAAGLAFPRARAARTPTVDPAAVFGLRDGTSPALTLVGSVLGVKPLLVGEGVSYGYTHRATSDTRVALVTGGYAQGIPRMLGNRARVMIGGRPHPIVGRVAMDVCVVDVGDTEVPRGAEVTFFGDPRDGTPGVSEWAALSGLTPLELVTAVGLHAHREHVR
jgi:alanine racemase